MISSETLAAAARVEAHAARRIAANLDEHSAVDSASESRPVQAASSPLRQSGNASNELQFLPRSPSDGDHSIRPAASVDGSSERHAGAMAGKDRIQANSSL
jgi:hypothetical protein